MPHRLDSAPVVTSGGRPDGGVVLGYVLQILALFTGLTLLVGVVLAYIRRGSGWGAFSDSHYTWQIRTFWGTLFGSVVGTLTTPILVGYLLLLLLGLWYLYRVVRGLLAALDGRAMAPS